ncbi:MAG: YtxH domain-containing protein [Alphaproteobacteria bacterium]|nr:YtxH domain-containing protein [Alphaproteobacteria bacterium]
MTRLVPLALGALLVGACGTAPGDRGLSGAGLGAGAGVVVGAVTGLTLAQGALVGAGVGAVTGLLTDPDKLDLGDPPWAD